MRPKSKGSPVCVWCGVSVGVCGLCVSLWLVCVCVLCGTHSRLTTKTKPSHQLCTLSGVDMSVQVHNLYQMSHSARVCWPQGGCTSRGQGAQVKSLYFPLQLAENLKLPYKNKVFRKQNGKITSSYEHFWLHTPQRWWAAKYFLRISCEFRIAPAWRQKDREHNRILRSFLSNRRMEFTDI